ncbi:MAG TPA: hypothetical protein VIG99_18775 [Myxococcaceae bacterium]|jgi:hypothetical protein
MLTVVMALLCAAPNYDAFSDPRGHIADERQLEAAQAMVRDPEQLEAVYADAAKGNPRAARVVGELEETYFPGIGRAVAEREAQLECTVMAYRELSRQCIPDWSYLDFLRKDAPGGTRARQAIRDGYVARARDLAIENRVVVATVNTLLAVAVVKGVVAAKPAAIAPAQVAPRAITIEEGGLAHVLERHFPGGAKSAGKSLFSAGETVPGLVRAAEPVVPTPQQGGTLQRVVNAGRVIGVDRATGSPTTIYTVITDASGNLVTAFPGVP